ncbi:hypothetical protein CBR_g46224 [Chara braunii]|uniref:Integrase catalytic domain-containing protein n=1 Tax=Chara braunii TaxID=69332 RepID=A0A388K3P4_CHABU|nr:hypothetical protein CBR_g46224 [Chara braunii]|eukprot:GBG64682.1 hypothetical protein CBR_g46224 [Chara braunii]
MDAAATEVMSESARISDEWNQDKVDHWTRKELKERFVQGLHGTTMTEIASVITAVMVFFILREVSGLVTDGVAATTKVMRMASTIARPGESPSMDFMDTLVTSKSGMRHIFVIVDRFSKYARLVAMPETAKTEYVIKMFKENWVRDFGLPKSIVSDRDVRFTSELWKAAAAEQGTQLQMTSGNHPEANGQAEQLNRAVQHLLRPYIKPNQVDRDEKLALIASLYNNAVHSATGVSDRPMTDPPMMNTTKLIRKSASDQRVSDLPMMNTTKLIRVPMISGLCHKEFTGMSSRAAKHFVQASEVARCKHNTVEIAAAVREFHPSQKICPLMMTKLNEYYRTQGRPPVMEDPVDLEPDQNTDGEGGHDTPSSGPDRRAGPTPAEGSGIGFVSTSVRNRAAPTCADDQVPSEIAKHLRGPVLASARPPRPPSAGAGRQQTSMASFVVDELQKEFEQAIASFFFENAIAFNAARSDSYKNMERIMNETARSRKMLKLPGYNFLRMKALPAEYKTMDTDLDTVREPWDVTGLTLMTDGTTTTSNRPVINFIAAGDSGAVMVKSVDMEGKDKSAPALARMWEEVIRELGVQRVNAICTDSAQVNISARKILAEHDDSAIGSIPWVPCACHVCNLLMSDIASVPWIGEVILQGREITTFIKRHQRALAMFRRARREYMTQLGITDSRPLELIQPGETRFGTNFVMLQRLREVGAVLLGTVSPSLWDRPAASRARACKELIRDPGWWLTVERACTLLQPVYSLMRGMDRDGRMGMQVWSLGITLEKRMNILPMDCETRTIVMKKVKERVRMMALPVHAAAWMLHPLHRSPRLFDDLESEEIMNTLAHFAAVYTKNSKEYKECWRSLESFHHKSPEWIRPNAEEALACTHVSLAQWWLTCGKNHKSLQEIAVAVLSMWTTASPCERNWSTFDLIHTKRRNLLSPENLQMLVFIHWNKKLLKMSKMKTGFVNTKRLEWETPEDVAPYDGFMKDGEYDLEEVKRRAANWSKSRGRRSKSTKFDIRELEEEREDDRAWLLDFSYRPLRLADHDHMDGPIAVALMEADAVADARGDDPVGEHGDDPAGATATDGAVGAVDDGAVGADTGTDDGPIASGDGFFTPDPELRLGESFASLLPHVAPIAPRGSAQDFCKHLASMSPMRTDDESYTPDWARFTGPTPPTLWLDEDIRLVAGEGAHAQVYRQRTTPVPDGGTTPPHDRNARRATGSPPEIDESKVRQVKSLAGRKKGGKNKGKEAAAPKTRGGRRNGRKTFTPTETLEEKSVVVRQAKRKKAQRVQQKAAAANRSPKRDPQKKRKRVQEDDESSSSSSWPSASSSRSGSTSSSTDTSSSTKDKTAQQKAVDLAMDWLLVVVPTVVCMTTLKGGWMIQHVLALAVLLLFCVVILAKWFYSWDLVFWNGPSVEAEAQLSSSRKPFLTNFRSLIMLKTCVAILAVDFTVFPRRFAKTESYGFGLMDVGVGSFVVTNALVSKEARGARPSPQGGVLRNVSPLLILGFSRLVMTKGVDYQEHVSEYGIHWNFFFTLAGVALLTTVVRIPAWICGVAGFAVISAYQWALSRTGLSEYLLSDERGGSLLNENKEGIFSCVGYWALYLISVELGSHLFSKPLQIMAVDSKQSTARSDKMHDDKAKEDYNNDEKEHGRPGDRVTDGKSKRGQAWWSWVACLTAFDVLLWVLTVFLDTYVQRASRRMCNMTFVIWILAQDLQAVILFLAASITFPHYPVRVLEGFDHNLLPLFLLANVLTGLANMTMDTIVASHWTGLLVITLYITVVSAVGVVVSNVRLKFW